MPQNTTTMRNTILLLLAILAFDSAAAQDSEASRVFSDDEELRYVVSYRAKLVPNTEVATVVFRVSPDTVGNTPALRIYANGTVMKFFRWFFDMSDTYNTWLDRTTLRPIQASSNIKEGNYRFSSFFNYDWQEMVARTSYRNHKMSEDEHRTIPLGEKSYDGIALFFNLRGMDESLLAEGREQQLQMLLQDTVRTVYYTYRGREIKKIKGLGNVRTLRFTLNLVTSTGESFEDGTELKLWISDDRNRIPLLVETPIRVGSVRARLDGYSNLKYEFDCVIPK